jgi:hypothetical protein
MWKTANNILLIPENNIEYNRLKGLELVPGLFFLGCCGRRE